MSRNSFVCALLMVAVSVNCLLAARADESKAPDTSKTTDTQDAASVKADAWQDEAKATIHDAILRFDNDKAVSTLTTMVSRLSPEEAEKLLRGGQMFEDSQLINIIPGFVEARKNGTDRDARIKRVIAVVAT